MLSNNIYTQGSQLNGYGNITDNRSSTELTPETRKRLKDPFENPTEYHSFRDDYSKILPWIKMQDYKIPLVPARTEKNMLKRQYSIGGTCMLLHSIASQLGVVLAMLLIQFIIKLVSGHSDMSDIYDYMEQSSVLTALNMIILVLANTLFAVLGLKWSKTDHPSLFRTHGFNYRYAIEYCFIALAIWCAANLISSGIEEIFNRFDQTTIPPGMEDTAVTGLGKTVEVIYACIMAPVTEEIFFRGMILRVFSKANQRFAVFASALFFGLGHGNIPQFALAFLLGIFLGHITLKHGSIIPSIIVHMFINTFVTAVSFLPDTSIVSGIINFILVAASVIGIGLLVIYRKTDRLPSATPAQSRRGITVAKTAPAFVGAILVMTALMAVATFAV